MRSLEARKFDQSQLRYARLVISTPRLVVAGCVLRAASPSSRWTALPRRPFVCGSRRRRLCDRVADARRAKNDPGFRDCGTAFEPQRPDSLVEVICVAACDTHLIVEASRDEIDLVDGWQLAREGFECFRGSLRQKAYVDQGIEASADALERYLDRERGDDAGFLQAANPVRCAMRAEVNLSPQTREREPSVTDELFDDSEVRLV